MAKSWYPVIDYELCIECNACFNKCSHGVYKLEGERPVVVYPEGCVYGCRGCQKLCPVNAIQYVGDIGGKESSGCGCCSC
ncbi:4Fe-4S dicluster domain-containing protein [Anaerobranca californiensis DSM 14826]|jgi:NAD-dependent dihydropyrimidine dehydrogenase PreA subunit|uniref:4Fe-4S dicluster domain-containing protein n=1 Tax=Anaerobranca californiensis DSM 14826 TaxID=1120989 RepID=A0A1M6MWA4_9FIRM|nr:4Fe-4S dicluster domain-containing protein [Anaerobranca californiensis]SHJ87670.1 4Fe-4S dicluster domain-containing protein [Anaerobranca californiensis DSM 14826]